MANIIGPVELTVPMGTESTVEYRFAFFDATRLWALLPHMHQLGTHAKLVVERAAGPETLIDAPFAFGDQDWKVTEVDLAKDEPLKFTCTYQNTRDVDVHFGQSSLEEMCFLGAIIGPNVAYRELP